MGGGGVGENIWFLHKGWVFYMKIWFHGTYNCLLLLHTNWVLLHKHWFVYKQNCVFTYIFGLLLHEHVLHTDLGCCT